MVEILPLEEWRKRMRDELEAEILHNDKHPIYDVETDRAIASVNKLIDETPLSNEEKIVLIWTKLIEQIAALEDKAQRDRYVKGMTKLLNQDLVEATRRAFAKF
jgi:16S rRNA G527 N7-methylase RsmG